MTDRGPAIIIAGTQSGSGKTTITLGLLAALSRKGHKVQPFKCGPDFIDPTLHQLVTGRNSRNLDLWMSGEKFVRETFQRHSKAADISVIEGVMGMFDGGEASSAALAARLDIPVVLVLDVRSAAESVAAVLKGFESIEPHVAPKAVILNRVASERHLDLVADAIEEYCQAEIIGFMPRDLNFEIPSRHLGLQMGEEQPISEESLDELVKAVSSYIDLERLVEIASSGCEAASGTSGEMKKQETTETPKNSSTKDLQGEAQSKVKIGVARDKAFCFYYEDNLDLLRQAGAELVFFSPLEDSEVPPDVTGLYLGGGYPELFAVQLSHNTSMLDSVRNMAEQGYPVYAECGGFMYLTQGIVNPANTMKPMAGVFPVTAKMQKRRASLGYREVVLRQDSIMGPAGTKMRGHEFHYSVVEEMPESIARLYRVSNDSCEGYSYKNVLGGYMHIHFGSNKQAVREFVRSCQG